MCWEGSQVAWGVILSSCSAAPWSPAHKGGKWTRTVGEPRFVFCLCFVHCLNWWEGMRIFWLMLRFIHLFNISFVVVQSLSHVQLFAPHGLQHTRLPCPSPTPGVCFNSCPSSQWCHPPISSSVIPFSSLPQSFPASGSFPVSQFFASGGKSIGASASASVLPMCIQSWFAFGLTGLICLLSKGLSRVFSSTTVWNHQIDPNKALKTPEWGSVGEKLFPDTRNNFREDHWLL